jgi:hypothetical protein
VASQLRTGTPQHAQDAIGLGLKNLFGCQRPPRTSAPACAGPAALEGRSKKNLRGSTLPLETTSPTPFHHLVLDRARVGGADRDRTDDLRLAKPALSQLSYSPNEALDHLVQLRSVVGLGRFELPTSRLSGGRSNQLSYRPAGRDRTLDIGPVSKN